MKVQPTGYWTFFCNPAIWEIDKCLARNIKDDAYTVDQYLDTFGSSQLGVIRVGNDRRTLAKLAGRPRLQPGIYAIVEVLSTPYPRGTYPSDDCWANGAPPPGQGLVVDLRYHSNLLHQPLLLKDLDGSQAIAADPYLLRGEQAKARPLDPSAFDQILALTGAEEQILNSIEPEPTNTLADIQRLEAKYALAAPKVQYIISKRIERGPVGNQAKALAGFKCMLCAAIGKDPIGFKKPNGEPYVEVHHVIPVAKQQAGTLGPANLITVCANHHRQLHYGNAQLLDSTVTAFVFQLGGDVLQINKLSVVVGQ